MPKKIAFNPSELTFSQTYTAGPEKFRLDYTFNLALADWRCTITKYDTGELVVADRRLSPRTTLLTTSTGEFWVFGVDPYKQHDLGTGNLYVEFWTNSEIAAYRARTTGGADPEMRLVT